MLVISKTWSVHPLIIKSKKKNIHSFYKHKWYKNNIILYMY